MRKPATVLSQRPRLLLVENSLQTTGAFISAMAMADALRADHDIEFVLPATSILHPVVEAAGIVCHSLPMSELGRSWPRLLRYGPVLLLNTVRLRLLLTRRKVDILVINDYYNLLGMMAKGTGWRGQLVTMVRLMPMSQQRVLNRVWTSLALWFSNKVVPVSRAVARQMPANDKVHLLYDPDRFNERHPDMQAGQTEGLVRCLYLANYIVGKGHLQGLQAFAQAYQQNPALRLRFVGGDMGLEKNRELKASLDRAALEMGLGEVVTCDGYSSDVELDIKQSDIVLNFSESESFSHTCLEACSYGRPNIATRCGGPEEIVEDGISGFLVHVKDVEAMGAALLRLSKDRALRDAMGQAGRRIVHERFSERQFVEGWHQIVGAIA
jgi:glycosyltransferase involved in cell wall biosynthesis